MSEAPHKPLCPSVLPPCFASRGDLWESTGLLSVGSKVHRAWAGPKSCLSRSQSKIRVRSASYVHFYLATGKGILDLLLQGSPKYFLEHILRYSTIDLMSKYLTVSCSHNSNYNCYGRWHNITYSFKCFLWKYSDKTEKNLKKNNKKWSE